MSSTPVALRGSQVPRILSRPSAAVASAGAEAADLAASAGLVLDDWQRFVLDVALAERADGKWAAFEVGLVVPRQNGKGAVLEARELAGLFLLGEQLILHSAHEFKTAQEAFRRVLTLVENTDWLRKQVARVRTSHGEEGIELKSGQRLRFVARSTGSGRGFSGDCVILDEAYNLPVEAMAALLPTMSARMGATRGGPQLWYTSSAGMASSTQLWSVRQRGIAGDKRLAYLEWSTEREPSDPEGWAEANPSLGGRITEEFVEAEFAALSAALPEFARERCGVWEDPTGADRVISADAWLACADDTSTVTGRMAFAVDVSPDRSTASVAVCGARADGLVHVELVDRFRSVEPVLARLVELWQRHSPVAVAVDQGSPAASLIPELEAAGVKVAPMGGRDVAAACGQFYDAVIGKQLRHLNQAELAAALDGARKRDLGDAWAWHRRKSSVDITPLVAATNARWAWAKVDDTKPVFAF